MSYEASFWMMFGFSLMGAAVAIEHAPRVARWAWSRVQRVRA